MKCALCRKATDHLVCSNCWGYTLDKLKVFPNRYEELAEELIPSKGKRSERVAGSKTPPLPVRIDILELRTGGISKPLMKHEANIRIIQHHTKITFRGQEINRIAKSVAYLTAQGEWIYAHYDDVVTLAKDINNIDRQINTVLGNRSELLTIGKCPHQSDDGEQCGAKLQINPASLTSFGDIKCKRCGTVWESTQWRLLGKMLGNE